jgi:chemotaxis protein histidine kinase CheA
MIELHGGRLAVESEHGSGSTFTAYLPLRTEAVEVSGEERLAPLAEIADNPAQSNGDSAIDEPDAADADSSARVT